MTDEGVPTRWWYAVPVAILVSALLLGGLAAWLIAPSDGQDVRSLPADVRLSVDEERDVYASDAGVAAACQVDAPGARYTASDADVVEADGRTWHRIGQVTASDEDTFYVACTAPGVQFAIESAGGQLRQLIAVLVLIGVGVVGFLVAGGAALVIALRRRQTSDGAE